MHRPAATILAGLLFLVCAPRATAATPDPAGIDFFESKVRPVLAERCYSCHSTSAEKLKGNLHLDTPAGIRKGGDSEMPAVIPAKPDDSLLLNAIKWELDDLRMPPKEKLPSHQVADIEAWIKMGAPMPADSPDAPVVAHKSEKMSLKEGRSFWSFIPPTAPQVPPTPAGGRNEIDAFVRAKLAAANLQPSPEADPRTLIRRATYDLTGLPPTAEEVENFIRDESDAAYEKLIDRLLASPRYGERWARHWLDVARYADSKGYVFEEERRYAFSYTYRDWVIRSLNQDLPYDQFLLNQIAADRLLEPGTRNSELGTNRSNLAALGFLTLGRRFINNTHDIIDDRIDVVTRGTMGLTVACARCHDHKYDPIPAADYYSLYGIFASSTEPAQLPTLGDVEKTPVGAEYEKEHARLTAERETWLSTRRNELEKELRSPAKLPLYLIAGQRGVATEMELPFDTLEDDKSLNRFTVTRWQKYLKEAATKNDPVFTPWRALAAIPQADFPTRVGPALLQLAAAGGSNPILLRELTSGPPPASVQDLAARYAAAFAQYDRPEPFSDDPAAEAIRLVLHAPESPTAVNLQHVQKRFNNADSAKLRQLQNAIDSLAVSHPGSPARAHVLEDLPTPVTPHVFKRGNPATPGDAVSRHFLSILSAGEPKPFTQGSGRLELARAIASKENPLTSRVIVNRIWQWHFGQGLVRTPSDFGTRGDPPTHPELLDHLATHFTTTDQWSLKKLHKRIMLSATYRQSSTPTRSTGVPPVLAASNNGEPTPSPSSLDPENRLLSHFPLQRLDFEQLRDSLLFASGYLDQTMFGRPVDIGTKIATPRRTLYGFVDRQNLPTLFRTFDFASPDGHVAQRPTTSVPQQALFMINSPFVLDQAKRLVARPTIAAQDDPRRKITLLYRTALARNPTPEELTLGITFIDAEDSQVVEQPPPVASAWQYGYGQYDEATGRLASFTPLPFFSEKSGWQGGDKLPDDKLGWALLTASGGHAGNDQAHAVVRRFTADRDCTVSVQGKLEHNPPEGDGVRARIVTPADGTLATWQVHHKSADTTLSSIKLMRGQTLDFIVDCGPANNFGYDQFAWTVTITKLPTPNAPAGDDSGQSWDSISQFQTQKPKPLAPLTPWEKYAQILLQSNEFLFID